MYNIKVNTLNLENYNLKLTLLSGQAFNWDFIDGWFYGKFIDKIVKIKQDRDKIYWQTYPKKDDLEFISNYLLIDLDYQNIIKDITQDDHVNKAHIKYPYLRLIKQPLGQAMFSYILASNKNIKSIRSSIDKICRINNQYILVENEKFYTFPKPEFFYDISESELASTGIGYRKEYIKDLAKKIAEDNLLEKIKIQASQQSENTVDEIRKNLKSVKGIGDKISDCILVFALGYHNLTPIDVWGDRIIEDLYQNKDLKNYNKKRDWFSNKFGKNTAWAGQYLFEYIRNYNPENYIKNEK
jgi:N-glycosylase/DNA lyase